jgi:dTDP-4-amino-4,6-dideoxygalactose transaminase
VSTAPAAVPFGDMKARVAALRVEIDAAVARVLESGWFILGPEGEAFERELAAALGAADAVGVANGTDAIELALHDLGAGPGDEVVTSPLTAAFTALAIARTGARPVFADLDPRTLNVAPEAVARVVTKRTKALLPVHLYGHPFDLDPLREIADAHGIMLVEDACQAVGARYKGRSVGSITGLGALSFYPTKNLGAFGDGGAILVNDPARAARLRRQRNGGQSDRYRHEVLGVNSRLDEMQAALLRVGLAHLPEWTARRRQIAALYLSELAGAGVGLPQEQPYAEAVYHLFVIRHPRRDALMAALKERGVGTLIHYPIPLHLQPAFPESGRPGDFPVAERAADEILSLPIYPEMTDAQVKTVAVAVRESVSALG